MASNDEPVTALVDIDDLTPWEGNPRLNDGKPVEQVAASIKRFGFASPIIARSENGEVIAGHTRLKAAKLLGLKQVPVRYLDLDEDEAHLLALADNRSSEFAEWDALKLQTVMSEFGLDDLDIAGWDQADLDILASQTSDGSNDAASEWEGMPEFDQIDKTAFRSIIVHFKDQAAVDGFAKTVDHKITDKTKYMWFPEIEIETLADKAYESD